MKDLIEVVSWATAAFLAYYYGIKFFIAVIREKNRK